MSRAEKVYYVVLLAGIASYVAMLPGPTQRRLLETLDATGSGRGNVSTHVFLASAISVLPGPIQHRILKTLDTIGSGRSTLVFLVSSIALMIGLVQSVRVRLRRPLKGPAVPLVPNNTNAAYVKRFVSSAIQKAINKENKNKTNTAFVAQFVSNILQKAISTELTQKLERQRKLTGVLIDVVSHLQKKRKNANSTVERVQTRLHSLQHREDMIRNVLRRSATEMLELKNGIVEFQNELASVENENEKLHGEIEVLEKQSLNSQKTITQQKRNLNASRKNLSALRQQRNALSTALMS